MLCPYSMTRVFFVIHRRWRYALKLVRLQAENLRHPMDATRYRNLENNHNNRKIDLFQQQKQREKSLLKLAIIAMQTALVADRPYEAAKLWSDLNLKATDKDLWQPALETAGLAVRPPHISLLLFSSSFQ